MPTMEWLIKGLEKPKGWPDAWKFPRVDAWPPSWPRTLTQLDKVKVDAIYNLGVLKFRATDRYEDETSQLDGYYLQIIAGSSDAGALRMKDSGSADWCEGMLIEITDCGKADADFIIDYGRSQGHRFLELSLYGIANSPVISLGV